MHLIDLNRFDRFVNESGEAAHPVESFPLRLLFCLVLWLALPGSLVAAEEKKASADSVTSENPSHSTADHRKFDQLKGPFEIGEITATCLECHTEASKQIHQTTHWTWQFQNEQTGQLLGKRNLINNFLGGIRANYASCTYCHLSFDWVDDEFDFTSEEQVDCLICHDTTGTYARVKFHQDGAKCPVCHDQKLKKRDVEPADLAAIARQVGPTSRATCGSCHFYGGAAGGAKHGDLDPSLIAPDGSLDVHMASDGLDFACVDCHKADLHMIVGSRYVQPPGDDEGIDILNGGDTCASCHGLRPMKNEKLNDHTDRVACQSCHIPYFARGGIATKMAWDWSTSGKRGRKGKALIKKDEFDRVIYTTQKGDTQWGENVIPEYLWFNGRVEYTLPGDRIDPEGTVYINRYLGNSEDPASRIFPVKVAMGKQPYDVVSRTLADNLLAGRGRDAYWSGYKWQNSLAAGMKKSGREFSGKFDFVETKMLWTISHMVAPARDALGCDECHSRDGRMAGIEGVYIPGRDFNSILDTLGFSLILLALISVAIHSAIRVVVHMTDRANGRSSAA